MARPQVALATSAALPQLDVDGPALRAALAAAGIDAAARIWDDPEVDWAAYDLVVVRSTWDYTLRREEFLAWAASVPRLANPADVLAWNSDKHHLAALGDVPVVPTTFVEPGEAPVVPPYEHVVKPTVSAGARDTRRFAAGEDSGPYAQSLLARGRSVMVQPYQAAVDEQGETALVFFLGVFSHAARKGPVLAPGAGHPDDVEIIPAEPTPAQLQVAQRALAAVPTADPLLYARVDLVPGPDGSPVLIELEVTEPSLFLFTAPGAADRLASAVRALV